LIVAAGILMLMLLPGNSNAQKKTDSSAKWEYLIRVWQGDGTGDPGEAKGWFSINSALDKNVYSYINLLLMFQISCIQSL